MAKTSVSPRTLTRESHRQQFFWVTGAEGGNMASGTCSWCFMVKDISVRRFADFYRNLMVASANSDCPLHSTSVFLSNFCVPSTHYYLQCRLFVRGAPNPTAYILRFSFSSVGLMTLAATSPQRRLRWSMGPRQSPWCKTNPHPKLEWRSFWKKCPAQL